MTKEERKYKILKKKKYEEQISQEEQEVIAKTASMGINVIAALVIFLYLTPDAEMSQRMFTAGLGLINTGYAAYYLKGALKAVSKKTKLEEKAKEIIDELKLDDLEKSINELKMNENEESRGMSR